MFNPNVVGEVSALTTLAQRKVLPGANRVDDSAAERTGLNMTAKRNVGFEILTAATEERDAVSDRISLKFRKESTASIFHVEE